MLLVLATSTGGVGRHVLALAAGLAARDIAVTVSGPAATEELFGFRRAGAQFRAMEIASGARPLVDTRAAAGLRQVLRRPGRPDLVHAHGLRAGLITALVRQDGLPLVLTLHNTATGTSGLRRLPGGLLERVAVRSADVVLAASADLARRARGLGARDVRLAPVVAPALPPAGRPAAEVRAELGCTDRPLLLAIGRLHPQKGFDVLIAAMASLAGRRPPPLAVLAGDGPAGSALRAQAAAACAPVQFLGRRSDIADLLDAADLVLLPSRWEARALVAQEALRAGRPLITTSVGGLPELVGDGAVLVAPEDPAALAAAVTALLDDPAAAAALAFRGRRRAASWPSEAAMLDQLTAVYADLAGRRPRWGN